MRIFLFFLFVGSAFLTNAQSPVLSLSGNTLIPPQEAPEVKAKKEKDLAEAEQAFLSDIQNMDKLIWFGRRAGYAWEFEKAIQMYTYGINQDPDNPELYRHRGHRLITVRKFDLAIQDLETAARLATGLPLQTEPDGQPNAKNIPLSNLHFNIYYHLGLAYYLTQNYAQAEKAYRKCLTYSNNDDLVCATTDWLYMTLCREGKMAETSDLLASITKDMDIIENTSYHKRLLMYKGMLKPEDVLNNGSGSDADSLDLITQGYGVANYNYCLGKKDQALALLQKLVKQTNWAAFGYIAAEADLAHGL